MIGPLIVLLALGPETRDLSKIPYIDYVQGRAGDVLVVDKVVKRCGVRHTEISYMRGPPIYHHPDDIGAGLSIERAELTARVRQCLRSDERLLRERYRALEFTADQQ